MNTEKFKEHFQDQANAFNEMLLEARCCKYPKIVGLFNAAAKDLLNKNPKSESGYTDGQIEKSIDDAIGVAEPRINPKYASNFVRKMLSSANTISAKVSGL